jgi:hypothetical protein
MQLLEDLGRTLEQVSETVPGCIGLSLARADHEGTCTLAASEERIAVLDAIRYLDGGHDLSEHLVDGRWDLFARACDAVGVRSTVTLPVARDDLVVGSVHLYAGNDQGLDERDEDLARALDAVALEVVLDSEVSLTTRRLAEPAPLSLRGEGAVNRAVGTLAVHLDIDVATAYSQLADAALRAGITPERLALALTDLHH